ncbi:hypothetical protein CRE_24945 [Caenorhabditis remanei]|uniref:Uncharacterized protein n=1 Tax=Caenorhabditis remanei TaxID=31234 RepID=E3MHX3_CAERE|nr:hypothetical protein CRE_24945 [Caenorhabditis remanei]
MRNFLVTKCLGFQTTLENTDRHSLIHFFIVTVIWLHKKKIESDAKQQKDDLDKFQSKFKLKESEIYGYRTKNKECLTELSSCQKQSKGEKDEKPNLETAEKLKIEISGLKKKVGEMEEKMKEMENDSNSMTAILKVSVA